MALRGHLFRLGYADVILRPSASVYNCRAYTVYYVPKNVSVNVNQTILTWLE